jgi:hypothetical protein
MGRTGRVSQVTRRVCASLCQAASHMMWSDEYGRKEGTRRESYLDSRVIPPRCGIDSTMNRGRMKSTVTALKENKRTRSGLVSYVNLI